MTRRKIEDRFSRKMEVFRSSFRPSSEPKAVILSSFPRIHSEGGSMKVRKPIMQLFCILFLAILAAPPSEAFGNFRIIVLPDTQNESQYAPSMFTAQTQWIVNNKSDIAFVAHVGDVVNTCTSSTEYNNAESAMDLLDSNSVPYGVSPGNHDQANSGTCGSSSLFPTYFGTSRYTGGGSTYPQGYYQGSLDHYNHYFFFSADGMDFIIIFLQYNPGATQTNWANNLLAANSNRRGIVISHAILNIDNSWLNQSVYTSLSGNPNLFLVLCGHMHSPTDGEALRIETRTNMDPVHIILSDYQDMSYGNGWLRILDFDPSADEITVTAYSPYIPSTGSSFSLSYDMTTPLYGDFEMDCDVDGSDLGELIAYYPGTIELATFAQNFGRSACP
jgi:hypothetical protein